MRLVSWGNDEHRKEECDVILRPRDHAKVQDHFDDAGTTMERVENGGLKCHKAVLCRASSVFRDTLDTGSSDELIEGLPVIDVSESYHRFSDFLSLVYDREDMARSLTATSMAYPPLIADLYEIAVKYMASEIEMLLEQVMLA